MARRVRIKDPYLEQRVFAARALVAAGLMAALLAVVVGRLVWLQVIQYDYYADLSQGNRVRIEPLPPDRGVIFDRKGRVLAENTPAYQLELTREQVPDLGATLQQLVAFGLLEPDDVTRVRRLVDSRRPFEGVPIRVTLTDEEIGRFAVHQHELPGLELRTRLARYYPQGGLAVHALGYVGTISEEDLKRIEPEAYSGTGVIGKTGLESSYEAELHGQGGSREVIVNAEGRSVASARTGAELRIKRPRAGNDLHLSLDIELTRVAEEALGDRRGSVVALDPWTGDVLALVSKPTFDPNKFARGITGQEYRDLVNDLDRPLFNRAVRGTYPPGSTIKPLMALAGLEYGVVAPTDTRFCPGYFRLPGSTHRYRDWKKEGHGTVDMHKAVMTSCDVYFYNLAVTLGIQRMHDSMIRMGFGELTGIDVDGERPGIMPSPAWKQQAFKRRELQVWFPGETVITGIGQGYWTVTPLQLAHATALLATRGKQFKPRLVTAVRDAASGELRPRAPVRLPDVTLQDAGSWEIIVDAMVAVTQGGTASRAARGATYTIAGKTGTAQVYSVRQGEKYNEKTVSDRLRDHALFVAFAPADAPKLAVAVLVENGGHGSDAAAPIARKIFDAFLLPESP